MVSRAQAARTSRRVIVKPHDHHDNHNSVNIYDGKTGEMIMRGSRAENGMFKSEIHQSRAERGDDVTVSAPFGIMRV